MKNIAPNPEQITFDQPSFNQWDEGEHIQSERRRRFDWERVFQRLRLMWSRREFLLKVAAGGLAVATVVAFLIPARYESEVQLMPPDSSSEGMMALLAGMGGGAGGGNSLSGGGGMLGSLASSVLGGNKNSALFMGVLQSRTVEDALIDRFNLRHVYGVRLEMQAEKKLSDKTEISEDRKSGILSLKVTDHDPKRAAALANGYTDELNALMANLSTSSAHRERVFLEGRLEDVSKDLEVAEQDLSQFSSKNATVDVNAQARAMLESSAMLQGQLVAAQSELEGLRQIFTDNNVRVRSTQARIAELKQQIKNMAGQPGDQQAQTSDSSPSASDGPYPTVRQLPILGVGYADHLRRVKVDEAVFETLTKEYEMAKVEEAKEIPTVKVLDAANIPERKSFPPRLIVMAFGTVFAGILGSVFVIASSNWNALDPHDPRKSFANEVAHKVAEQYPWLSSNGSAGPRSNGQSSNGSHD